jgi:catechol 2,3-dioxygenase-like lactoylglutathione lyase family enzyme
VGAILTLTVPESNEEARPNLAKVIVRVTDMQRAVEFYRDAIGLEVERPLRRGGYGDEQWVTFNAGACTLALNRGADGEAAVGGNGLVITVADIERARQRLSDHGIDAEAACSPAPGIVVINVRDPDSNRLSIEAFVPAPWEGPGEPSFWLM